jgi:biopolymer transport protein ExbD
MKRFSERSGYNTMAELNVTPMLDLAFVLLIIFIITTPLMENSIEIDLPTASHPNKPPEPPPTLKTITVDRNAQIYLEGKPISARALELELARLKESTPDLAVVVKADKEIKYQVLIDVFDALEKAKVTRLGLMHLDGAKQ